MKNHGSRPTTPLPHTLELATCLDRLPFTLLRLDDLDWARQSTSTSLQIAESLPPLSPHPLEEFDGRLDAQQKVYYAAWDAAFRATGVSPEIFKDSFFYPTIQTIDGAGYAATALHTSPLRTRMKSADEQNTQQHSSCPLCRDIASGLDRKGQISIPSNILSIADGYALMVNRYPYIRGDALLLPLEGLAHTKTDTQSSPGCAPSLDFMRAAMRQAEKYRLIAHRNHERAGKSVLSHDHFKMQPQGLHFQALPQILELHRPLTRHITEYAPTSTPFPSLALASANLEKLAFRCHEIVARLEEDQQIFTLIFGYHHWLITPWLVAGSDGHRATGSLLGSHGFAADSMRDPHAFAAELSAVPRHGHFPWEKYL